MSKVPAQPDTTATTTPIPAVVYAAKSTEDLRGSIATQLADCRAAADSAGRHVIAAHSDEAASAFKGNRGPGLEAAKRDAAAAAKQNGAAELWVQHSDRLARGDGLSADHLAEVFFAMRRQGVRLRSVQDDHNLEDALRAVLIGERNHEDSSRKAQAVASGLRRAFERGEHGGGPTPDGYALLVERDVHDRVVQRTYRFDPERSQVIRLMFELADRGMGDPSIAKELNRRGHLTQGGIAWTRRRVQDTLRNPFYAGRVVWHRGKPDEEIGPGLHPALIERERFDRLLAARDARDKAAGSQRNPTGRPPTNHALGRLAVCGYCGGPIDGRTSTYVRKDGTRRRTYLCRASHDGSGACEATWSYDAQTVDRAVVARLDRYLGDFDAWREQIEDAHAGERQRLSVQVERAEHALADVRGIAAKLAAEYERHLTAGDDARADAVLSLLTRRRHDVELAQRRLQAVQDAIASVPTEAPADAMLDFYTALADGLRGRLACAENVAQVNMALRDTFDAFVLAKAPDGGVQVLPVLKPGDHSLGDMTDDDRALFRSVPDELHDQLLAELVNERSRERWGLVIARGDDQVAPPLRPIATTSSKLTQRHE
jgi:DNA invertase Pin-like site-specific DNA recombinase